MPVRVFPSVLLGMSLIACSACNQAPTHSDLPPVEKVSPEYASLGGQELANYQPANSARTAEQMVKAADAFLASLNDDTRAVVNFPLQDPERRVWTNSPARGNAGGLALGTLNRAQLHAAYALFATVLSEEGFNKLRGVMLGDDLRSVINGVPNSGVGISDFRMVLFGTPALGQEWALQIDGHHVAINVTVGAGGEYSMSPSFIGTFPQRFKVAGKEYQPLDGELDLAYALVDTLSPEQLQAAVVSPSRQGLRAGAGQDGVIPDQTGVSASTFDVKQKTLLLTLASRWISMMPEAEAQATRARLEAQVDQTTFSWHGPVIPGSDISYVIQSPSMIFELGHDNRGGAEGSSPVDHIHTMFRDFKREYGEHKRR